MKNWAKITDLYEIDKRERLSCVNQILFFVFLLSILPNVWNLLNDKLMKIIFIFLFAFFIPTLSFIFANEIIGFINYISKKNRIGSIFMCVMLIACIFKLLSLNIAPLLNN
jgi:hypothetical protein